jgi:hypothetical protein
MATNEKTSSSIAEAIAVLDNDPNVRNYASFNVGGKQQLWKDLNPLIKTEILLKGNPDDLYTEEILGTLSEHFKTGVDYTANHAIAMDGLRSLFNTPDEVKSEKDFKSTFVDEDALRGIIPSTKEYQSMAYAPGEASDYDKANIGKKRNLVFTDKAERAKYLSSLGINPPKDSTDKVAAQQYEEDKKQAMRDLASSLAKIEYDDAENKYDTENSDWGKTYASFIFPRTVERIERGEYDKAPMGNYGIGDLGKLFGNRSSVADIGELAASAIPGKAIANLVERIPGKIAAAAAPAVGKVASFLVNNAAGPLVGNFVDPNMTAGEATGKTIGEGLTNAVAPPFIKSIAKGGISKLFGDAPPAVVRSILRESPEKNLKYIDESIGIMEKNFGEFADEYAKNLTTNEFQRGLISQRLKDYFDRANVVEKAEMLSGLKNTKKGAGLRDPLEFTNETVNPYDLTDARRNLTPVPSVVKDDPDLARVIGQRSYPKNKEESLRFLRENKKYIGITPRISEVAARLKAAEIIDAASDPNKLKKALTDFKIENYMLSPTERKNRFGHLDVTEPNYFYGSDKQKKATKLLRNIPPDNIRDIPRDFANIPSYNLKDPIVPYDLSMIDELQNKLRKSRLSQAATGLGDFKKPAVQRGLSFLRPLKAAVDIVGGPIDAMRPGTKQEVQDLISGGGDNKDLEEDYKRAKDLYNYQYPSYTIE